MNKDELKQLIEELVYLNVKIAKRKGAKTLREFDRIIYGNKFRATYLEAVNNMQESNVYAQFEKRIESLKTKIERCELKDLHSGMIFSRTQRKTELERELDQYRLCCELKIM